MNNQLILCSTLRSSSSISIPPVHLNSSLNGSDFLVDGSEIFPTSTASTTLSDAQDPSATQSGAIPDASPIDHVDFDQWLNMDVCGDEDEHEDAPSLSMLWDYPDYGPLDKFSNEDAGIESTRLTNATSWNSSSYTSFKSGRGKTNPDMALSNHHTTDPDNDRPGSLLVGVDACRKRGWSEFLDADSHSQTAESLESILLRWIQHFRASTSVPNHMSDQIRKIVNLSMNQVYYRL